MSDLTRPPPQDQGSLHDADSGQMDVERTGDGVTRARGAEVQQLGRVELSVGKHARRESPESSRFARVHQLCELLSFVAIIGGVPLAYIEYRSHNDEIEANDKRERVETAQVAYRDVDARFSDFVTLCLAHPRLDCYSVSHTAEINADKPLTLEERLQQEVLYTELTDLFEVAFVQYHPPADTIGAEVEKIFDAQWDGWDAYIKKFIGRPAYAKVWANVGNEYDSKFQNYMDSLKAHVK